MGDIMAYNGSGVVAMTGKNCVGIASDRRYGIRQQTVACDMQRLFEINDKCYVGLAGLATDVQTFYEKLTFRVNLFKLREERDIKVKSLSNLISNMLYEKRFGPFFVEPVIAGLDKDNKPFVTAQDFIGAGCNAEDFVVAGTCAESLFGMCESLYKEDMEPEDLFETLSQCLLAAVDRDALSGWGGIVHIITPDKIITRTLKTRQD